MKNSQYIIATVYLIHFQFAKAIASASIINLSSFTKNSIITSSVSQIQLIPNGTCEIDSIQAKKKRKSLKNNLLSV